LPKPVNIEELLIRVGTVLKIKKANDEIKKLRSEFTYLLVQDLKNTISVIKATFELALKDKFNELTEDQKLILDIAESAINNHIKLLDEYLELSRLELNIDKITRESANIAQLIQGVINKFKTDQKYKDLNINFSPDIEVNLEVDVKKISRVFELLFGAIFNAGGRDIEISLGDDGTSCTIKVWDKNTKIEREEAEYIFDRYKQAVKQKIPRYKDLGLMICRIIVEAHNGKIWAEPLDEGTAFFIKIPKVS
jgi:signal transduction histidine kinase